MKGETTPRFAGEVVRSDSESAWRWFLLGAAVVLAVAGIAKMWGGFGSTRLLAMTDPLTGVSFHRLLPVVGVAEVVFAGFCVFGKNQRLTVLLVAWLATIFMVYRMCLWWLGWQRPCGCLGSLARVLHLSEHTADNLMQGVLAYLLLGSYGWLLWQWRQGRGRPGEDGG